MPDSHRIPVQLIESAADLLIFVVLLIFFLKNKRGLMPLYLTMYSVVRFADEFIRGDAVRGVIMGVSFSQIVSVVLLAVSAYMIETGKPYSPGYLDLPVRKT
jgi:phosphatidylglycerol:prolipoprotein diacylglycerol transferase